MGIGGLRVYGYRTIQAGQRFLILAKPDQRETKIALGCRMARIDRQGATDKGYAFIKPAGRGRGNAGKVQRIKITRVALYDGAKTGLGISGAALLEKRNGFCKLLFDGAWRGLHGWWRKPILGNADIYAQCNLMHFGRQSINKTPLVEHRLKLF
jgi:hypothetical protein